MFHIIPNTWFCSSKNCWEQTVLLCSPSQPAHNWVLTFFNSIFEIFLESPFESFTFEVKGGSSKAHITSLEVISESLAILWTMGGRQFITLCIFILNRLVISLMLLLPRILSNYKILLENNSSIFFTTKFSLFLLPLTLFFQREKQRERPKKGILR